MAKCSECGRPKQAWVQKVQRLRDELLQCKNTSDDATETGYAQGMNAAGQRLAGLLEELK